MTTFERFSNWINDILKNPLPQEIIAFNFNIYEGSQNTYDIELIGSNIFDEDNGDWACCPVFSSGQNLFFIDRSDDKKDWKEGLSYIEKLIIQYIEVGVNAMVLKEALAVGIGFVDGDIQLVYKKTL